MPRRGYNNNAAYPCSILCVYIIIYYTLIINGHIDRKTTIVQRLDETDEVHGIYVNISDDGYNSSGGIEIFCWAILR